MPFNIGPGELILILVIALVLLGPARLPDVAQSLGKSIREFRKAASDVSDAGKVDVSTQPATTQPTVTQVAPPPPAPVIGTAVPPPAAEAQTVVPEPSSPAPPAPSEAVARAATADAAEATAEPRTGADRDSTAS